MNIKRVSGEEKEKMNLWKDREYRKYEKEAGYNWNEKSYALAAYDKSGPVGYVKLRIVGGVGYLDQIIVSKSYRRKGAGVLLLKRFEDLCRNKDCHLVYLRTSDRYKSAVPFYLKNGYKISATLKDFIFHDTWYIFEKRLKSRK